MEPVRGETVSAEARWPMAGAILSAMLLTVLLPDDVRLGPQWALPLIEGVLLIVVIAADPRSVTRRSRELRAVSIALVSVLVVGSLWSTALLIDDLVHGGPETNSASELLKAGSIVWLSNAHRVHTALLGARRRRRGCARPRAASVPRPGLPAAAEPDHRATRLAPAVCRLRLPQLHQLDRVQPDRRDAVGAVGQARDGGAGDGLARHSRARDRPGRECVLVAGPRFGYGGADG